MGGRGSASGLRFGDGGTNSVIAARDIGELGQYMLGKYGTAIDQSLSGQDFELIKNSAAEIERIANEFPRAAHCFKTIQGQDLGDKTYARSSGNSGTITTSNQLFDSPSSLDARYRQDVADRFHPEGTTYRNIATHEAGHILERALIEKAIKDQPGDDSLKKKLRENSRIQAWNQGIYSKRLISEACKAAKKTPDGKGKKNEELREDVSKYASKNFSETLAECVSDYAANGSNAKPLSREVWKILKRELG